MSSLRERLNALDRRFVPSPDYATAEGRARAARQARQSLWFVTALALAGCSTELFAQGGVMNTFALAAAAVGNAYRCGRVLGLVEGLEQAQRATARP